MGYYNMVSVPCVVGKLHYATIPAQPIQVDDDVAAPLVESGSLEPYRPSNFPGPTGTVLDHILPQVVESGEAFEGMVRTSSDLDGDASDDNPQPAPRRSRTRKSASES